MTSCNTSCSTDICFSRGTHFFVSSPRCPTLAPSTFYLQNRITDHNRDWEITQQFLREFAMDFSFPDIFQKLVSIFNGYGKINIFTIIYMGYLQICFILWSQILMLPRCTEQVLEIFVRIQSEHTTFVLQNTKL